MIRILTLQVTSSGLKLLRHLSSASQTATQTVLCSGMIDKDQSDKDGNISENKTESVTPKDNKRPKLVSAAFEMLKTSEVKEINDSITKMIAEAKGVNGLLSIVKARKLTKSHALKLVSVLADWTVEGKINTSDFEKDPRFAVVCEILGNKSTHAAARVRDPQDDMNKTKTDLTTVLGVASDDEAAKMISNISLNQMIKVLSTLAVKKRRSTPLLRSLAYNIASSHDKLDIKQGADALYALATLNFHDETLLDKLCSDICSCLMNNTRRAVVGSIITSIGILRYKHLDLLNLLSEWVEAHLEVCSSQDLTSLVRTLAVVNHTPANEEKLFPTILGQLNTSGVPNHLEWLDLVWALTVLNKQTHDHVSSVLSSEFADKITAINTDGLTVPTKLKLLNINGVAKLRMKNYTGPLLDTTSGDWKVLSLRSKEKQALVTVMQETMLNLLPSAIYLKTNVDLEMGFLVDAECLMSSQLTPLPLFDKKTKALIDRSSPNMQKGIKIAILVSDYHDTTRGRREPTGVSTLCHELTRLRGYRIVILDHTDFSAKQKLVTRVQHLNQLLKTAVGKTS